MAIVDDRGRLFGRLNLLDAVLLVLLVGLVPLGYAAYALFREQPARIVSVSPARAEQASHLQLIVKGENLRPYMRVSAGTHQAVDFQFRSTSEVEVPFSNLPPGEYDIVLFDQAQERSRLPKALVIEASKLPPTEIVAVGAFGNLDAASAAKITAGLQLAGIGEVVAVGKPVADLTKVFSAVNLVGVPIANALRLPAVVKFRCNVRTQQGRPHCSVGDATIAPTALMMLPTPMGETPYQIEQLRSPHPLQEVPIVVRFSGHPNIISMIKAGDIDRGGTANELAAGARVESVSAVRRLSDSVAEAEVRLTVQAQNVDNRWLYDSAPMRAGGSFVLRTPRYEVTGLVIDIPPVPAPSVTQ